MKKASFWPLITIYLKAGNTTFGGGDPTIAVLQRELGERRGWLSEENFALAYSVSRITPGTNILAFCAATAYQLAGWIASIAAVVASTAPSAVVVVWLTIAFQSSDRNFVTKAALGAVLASVAGMMAASIWLLAKPSLTRDHWIQALVIIGGTLLLRQYWNVSPILLLLLAATAGFFWKEGRAA